MDVSVGPALAYCVWAEGSIVVEMVPGPDISAGWAHAVCSPTEPVVEYPENSLYQVTVDAVEEVLMARDRAEIQAIIATSEIEWEAMMRAREALASAARRLWIAVSKTHKQEILEDVSLAKEITGGVGPADLELYLERSQARLQEWEPAVE